MNIGNMIIRMVMRRFIGMGVNKGIGMAMGATRRRGKGSRPVDDGYENYNDRMDDSFDENPRPVKRRNRDKRRNG